MSILIRGMEMPKNCKECQLGYMDDIDFDYVLYCTANKKYADLDMYDHPMGWNCPLIEVPPHGRLIDADELANKTFYGATSAPYITYKKFVDAPTVIEAERSETDA